MTQNPMYLTTCCIIDGVVTDYDIPTVLDVVHLQLCFMSTKKESCLSLYIVPGSHRIDWESSTILIARKGFVLSCIVILIPIIVIRRCAFSSFSCLDFLRKIMCSYSSFDLLLGKCSRAFPKVFFAQVLKQSKGCD
jgi:hypothetical protein